MASAPSRTYLTPGQYLAIERKAEGRHEYFRGQMFAVSGASREHNLIAVNIGRILGNLLEDRPCEVYLVDMRVRIEATGLYTYPDVVVVCDPPRFEDSEVDVLLNPTLLVEVLSPSTETYDRGKKFAHYRTIPSLRAYVMVSQEARLVERYDRRGEDWIFTEFSDPDETVHLGAIGCDLRLGQVYAKVAFPETPAPDVAP